MTLTAALVAAVLGALIGEWVRRALAPAAYRMPAESGPVPRRRWLPPAGAADAGLLTWHLVDSGRWGVLPAHLALLAIGLVLTAVDLDVHRLPDRLTLGGLPVLTMLLALDWDGGRMLHAAFACLVTGLVFLVLALAVPGGLGLGDVKLAALLALVLGWWGPLVVLQGLTLGFVIGGVVALGLVLARRANRHTHVAFGPSLLLGALCAVLTAS